MFLYFGTFIALLIMLYIVTAHPETFTDVPLLVVNVTRSPRNIVIMNRDATDLKCLQDIDHISTSTICKDCQLYVKDFYAIQNSLIPQRLVAVLPTEKTLVFLKQRNMQIDETLKDVFTKQKTMGYFDDSHKDIIQKIAFSYGIRNPNIKLIQQKDSKTVYAVCVIQEIEYKKIDLGKDYLPDVLDLGDVNINIIKTFFPYILIKNKDFKRFVHEYQDRYSIKTCFVLENMLVGDDKFDNVKYKDIILEIQAHLKDTPKRNFYGMFTTTTETFVNSPVTLEQNKNIPGFYDSSRNVFTVFTNSLDGVFMRPLDQLILKNQERTEENGNYTLTIAQDRYLQFQKDAAVLKESPEQIKKYVCVGDPLKTTKVACEQNQKNVWDRPCEQNTECPFYQANKHYKNYRGGCIDGKCELPIGVTPKGFRKYDSETKPLCYGCPIKDPTCCYTQKKPDYVFSMDSFERMADLGNKSWYWKS